MQGPHEKRLLNHLLSMDNYNTLERPVANESDALEVRFGLTLQQIIDVVSSFQILLLSYNLLKSIRYKNGDFVSVGGSRSCGEWGIDS